LRIQGNQITSFDATAMTSLDWLYLSTNYNTPPTTALLTNVNVTGLVNLTKLVLSNNKLTWSAISGLSTLSSLTWLNLNGNQLTQFDGTGLSSLLQLDLFYNQLTTSAITNLPSTLTKLNLRTNLLATFNATSLTNLTYLHLQSNSLTSVNLTGLSSLNYLNLSNNLLPAVSLSGLTSLVTAYITWNRLQSLSVSGLNMLSDLQIVYNANLNSTINNQILQELDQNGVSNGKFWSNGGRTSASNSSYTSLTNKNWVFNATPESTIYANGLNLIPDPVNPNKRVGIRGNYPGQI
jgi:hypothetical protein